MGAPAAGASTPWRCAAAADALRHGGAHSITEASRRTPVSRAAQTRRQAMTNRLEQLCIDKGMRMTEQRRVIARVLADSEDHPDVEELYRRAAAVDDKISIATVYRTVRLFEDAGILERHEFRDGRARYEQVTDDHHDHLIDLQSGEVIEFNNDEIERLQEIVARELGYRLVDHRLELYGIRLRDTEKK
jgi:Fur family ferric uptake transcriptional regulator